MLRIDIPIVERRCSYWLFAAEVLPSFLRLSTSAATAEFEAMGSSRFYLSEDGHVVGKVTANKYNRRHEPVKWLLHDYLEKWVLLQADAAKEYRSLMILRRASLRTPYCYS